MSTRNGKIARLPKQLREELNRRMQEGEQGEPLLEWLNGQPEVVELVKERFNGIPINKQSLSEWRLGGYEDWMRHENARELVRQLFEQAGDLNLEVDGENVSDLLGFRLCAEMVQTMDTLLKEESDPKERWRRIQELLARLTPLRRAENQAARLRLEQERWEIECRRQTKADEDESFEEAKQRMISSIYDEMTKNHIRGCYAGGKLGKKITDLLFKIRSLHVPNEFESPIGDPGESDQVRPGQTKKNKSKGAPKSKDGTKQPEEGTAGTT